VLDVEVVRLSPDWDEALEQRLVEWAHALGARHLLVVSDDSDRARTLDGLARVARRCDEAGLTAVLEFMRFTHPRTLDAAVALAREIGPPQGPPLGGVLVDALHLDRSGGQPEDLDAFEPSLFPYVQICDAPARPTADDVDALIAEARHGRLEPGAGALPLAALLQRFPPATPISVEVQSDALERTTSPEARARLLMNATLAVIEGAQPTAGPRSEGPPS